MAVDDRTVQRLFHPFRFASGNVFQGDLVAIWPQNLRFNSNLMTDTTAVIFQNRLLTSKPGELPGS